MKSKPPHLNENDQQLWDDFTRGVRKITHDKFIKQPAAKVTPPIREKAPNLPAPRAHLTVSQLSSKEVKGIIIDKTIDLHGLKANEAKTLVEQFIWQAYRQNLKWLLIVTGKGKADKPGVLRASLPEWLHELSTLVIGYAPAHIKDGGFGAFYVKIRRSGKDLRGHHR